MSMYHNKYQIIGLIIKGIVSLYERVNVPGNYIDYCNKLL
jgi:hypothetical protein